MEAIQKDSKFATRAMETSYNKKHYQLMGSLPHHSLTELAKKHGPIMHLQLGEVSNIIISTAEYAKEVFKTQGLNFAGRPFLLAAKIVTYDNLGVVFAPYGDFWRQMRKICLMELLSTKRVRSFRLIREEELSILVKTISSSLGCVVSLSRLIFSSTNNITCNAAFGKRYINKDHESFVTLVDEMVRVGASFSIGDLFLSVEFLHSICG